MTATVYLDNHATTAVDPRVLELMLPYFTRHVGNAASSHAYGTIAAQAVETARGEVATAISADQRELVFTSGATESNNLAIKGVLRSAPAGAHVIVSAAEHRAVLDPVNRLRREGFEVSIVPVDQHAQVTPAAIEQAIRPGTALVSVMHVNNEVGTINPVTEIADVCRRHGVPFHCDAAQSLGRVELDVGRIGADLLSLSAHKAYGPKGVGALFVRRDRRTKLEPLVHGGGHEAGLRSGTIPVPLVVGFGAAARLAQDEMQADVQRIGRMRDALWRRLLADVPELVLNGHASQRVAANLNFSVPEVDGDVLLDEITTVAISSGSACSAASPEPSHVLQAMGRSASLARASIRCGIGRFNTADEIEVAAESIIAAIRRARSRE